MNTKNQILTRLYMVLTALSIVPLFVVGQMVWILLADGEQLESRGRDQAQTTVEVPAMRGTILDRAGRALAINTATYDLALDPTVDGFSGAAATFYAKLSDLTGRSEAALRRAVARRHSPQYVMLHRGLTEAQHDAVEGWDVPGLIVTPRFDRRYNHGTTAAHVLGHVDADGHGLAGLELSYDEALTGTPGRQVVKRDRKGRITALVGGAVQEPKHGDNLVLTIDLVRQAAMEDELRRGVEETGAAWASAVAMDPNTGAILAMANVPTYNPNRPGATTSRARRNRAITDRFEPGSTFKLVPAIAAVEQNLVAMDDTLDTGDGWAVFHGHTMQDVAAYGRISFADVIAKSSNVGMAKTARRLTDGTLYQYARNLGFGQPTWIDLPGEVGGTLKKPMGWSRTTRTSMSIGYEVAVTPLQLLAAYSALANGGWLVKPHVVDRRESMQGAVLWQNEPDTIRQALQRETAEALRPAFEAAVRTGTATAANVEGLEVAGKTGTALQVSDGAYSKDQARASFVGFFPADDPAVALLVLVGEPETSIYGGAVAAPIFRRIARRWAGTFPDVRQRIAPDDPALATASTAPVRPASAVRTASLPAEETGTLPDLTGHSARYAAHWLRARGIDVRLQGRGTVARQQPRAGSRLPRHVTLRCTDAPSASP